MNRFLLWVGDAFAAILQSLGDGASWALTALDGLIGPALSPLFSILNPIANAIGRVTFDVLGVFPKWASLTVLSALLGVVMLFAFKYLSNQRAIGRVKDDISANLLALKLYKDELRVTALSQLRLLWAVLRLQRYVLTPVLILLLPMLLMLGQMGTYYQWEPVRVNETVLLRVQLVPQTAGAGIELAASDSVRIDAGPVASHSDVVWRLTPLAGGNHVVTVTAGDQRYSKVVSCGDAVSRVSAMRPAGNWTSQLLHPMETPIPTDARIRAITLEQAKASSWFCGGDYWVVSLFVVSMIAALLLKPFVGVRF